MPNWVENELTIIGKDHEKCLEAIKNREDVFDFNKVIPYPEEFKKMDEEVELIKQRVKKDSLIKIPKDGYNSGGFEWCCNNWGTKWGACRSAISKTSASRVTIKFDTAWAPPHPVVIKLSEMFPKLKFRLKFYEGGMSFQGRYIYQNGEAIAAEDKAYHGSRGG